jgi:thiol-disulfide isomerase/thioredoxin
MLGSSPKPDSAHIKATITYAGNSDILLNKQTIHYKYATQKQFDLEPGENNIFQRTFPVDSAQIVDLVINETSYPLYVKPGDSLIINAERGTFPSGVQVEGYENGDWTRHLNQYLRISDSLMQHASRWRQDFNTGTNDSLLHFYKKRVEAGEQFLDDAPFDKLKYKAIGEYLVHRLKFLRNRTYHQEINPSQLDSARAHILKEAKIHNFFTFRSQWAQRAGIFDFANAYAFSFGIEKKIESQQGQELMKYDVKRLGYPILDSLKVSLLSHIDERRARAYAKMYLIAERIGEMPIDTARPSYRAFIKEYKDYPRFTSFLKEFYRKRQRVSPGNPAIPFSLPTPAGDLVKMSDYRGTYVLLDFWASWCIPCLDEFPHMKELYKKYPRSKFEIVGISIEKDSLRWQQALDRFELPWPQVYGGNGFQQATFSSYQAGGIPFYILVGPQGKIIRYNDVRPSYTLPQVIDSLISKTDP